MRAADPNGPRPSPDAIDEALRFVELLPADAPTPHVSVADDGEVNFFRRGPGLFIDVGFFGDGRIHYYARVDALEIDVDGSAPFSVPVDGGREISRRDDCPARRLRGRLLGLFSFRPARAVLETR